MLRIGSDDRQTITKERNGRSPSAIKERSKHCCDEQGWHEQIEQHACPSQRDSDRLGQNIRTPDTAPARRAAEGFGVRGPGNWRIHLSSRLRRLPGRDVLPAKISQSHLAPEKVAPQPPVPSPPMSCQDLIAEDATGSPA